LPGIAPDRLIKLASDKRPAVRETAVRALGRLDARQGITELLAALGDDRARWAVYALRAALCDLPPARVLDGMRTVPLGKVTVAKLASRIPDERAAALTSALSGATTADAPAFGAAFTALLPLRDELTGVGIHFATYSRFSGERVAAVHSAVLAAVEKDGAA